MIAGLKKLIWLVLLAGICYGGYYLFFHEKETFYGLTVSEITRGDITATVTATGELNAINIVAIGTQISGRVQEIYIDFNSPVKAGQLLALIDPSVLSLTLKQQEAELQVNQAKVLNAQAALNDAQTKHNRNKELLNRKLIAKSQVDASEADLEVKRASLRQAQSQVLQAQASLEKARTNLNYTRIISPVNGVVIDKQVEEGQTVAASYQTPTLFKIAQDLTQMQIEAKVDEADIGSVQAGQNVSFRVDAFPEENFSGKVVQVRLAPNSSSSVVTYTVIIRVDNPELKLKPGMTANVSIETKKAQNVLCIPVAALRFTPPEGLLATISFDREILTERRSLNSGILWPEDDGFMMRPVQVETGISDNNFVELVKENSGRRPILQEGTELVINAQAGAKKGEIIRLGGLRIPGVPRLRVPGMRPGGGGRR